jgi:Anti-sigma-28 factor, FlgM
MKLHGPSCLPGPVVHRLTRGTPMIDNEKPVPLDDPDVRTELVARVRREIAEGTYDTDEKLEAALERLRNRLEWQD